MDLDNIVTCDNCHNYNPQLRDCKAKNFEKVDLNCRNCDLYHPTIKKSFSNVWEEIRKMLLKLINH